MPFTLLVIAVASNFLMMLDVYQDILNSKEFITIDSTIAKWLFNMRSDGVARIVYIFTQIGNGVIIAAGVVILSVVLISNKKSYMIPAILISVAGSAVTVYLGKNIFKINRPVEYSYYHIDSFSFPSGHSTAAVAFYGIVFFMLINNAKKIKLKFFLFVTWLFLVLAIGFSRMYLCEHFLSDVVGGYLLGFLWLLLSISVILWEEDRQKRKKTK